jgi:double zinc ribbon protein
MLLFQETTTTTTDEDLFAGVRDFFDSDWWLVVRNVALFFAVAFWIATAYWVYKDARRRIEDPWLIAVAVALGVFPPFLGPLIYMLFRPPEYLDDVRERELEIRAMEETIGHDERCPVCRAAVDQSFLACPVCTTKLRQACRHCRQPLEPMWQICPYCETPVDQPTAAHNL